MTAWQTSLRRSAAHRRATILDGNVADEIPAARGGLDLATWIAESLTEAGAPHDCAIICAPDGRVRFPDGHARRFARLWGASAPAPDGDAYDLGDDDGLGDESPERIDPQELLAFVEALAEHDERGLLVVLERVDLMTTDPSRLAEPERRWVLAFTRAVRAGQPGRGAPHLVLITRRLGGLPAVLYQNDPRVQLITVPRPSRAERQRFFERDAIGLKVAPPPLRPGDRRPQRERTVEALVDLTDALTRVDLRQLVSLSQAQPEAGPADRLLNLYRYGEERSPWEALSEEKVRGIEAQLAERVVGQDAAIAHVASMVRRAWLGLSGLQHSAHATSPKGRLFFVGPTGVGKTELAKALAAFLFGDERACLRFDMSEYNHEHSDQRLVGAPPGYVGFEDGGQLTNAVRARPFSVLLFDEIEKAHPRILDKFLQILEDGRLTDGRGETTWFGETVIIFTSNLGAANSQPGLDEDARRQHFVGAVRRHFVHELGRPELLNRLGDNIVAFEAVTDTDVRLRLLRRKLVPVAAHLRERYGAHLQLAPGAEARILAAARQADGGRGLLNAIERVFMDGLARFLIARRHQLRLGRQIRVTDAEDGLAFDIEEA